MIIVVIVIVIVIVIIIIILVVVVVVVVVVVSIIVSSIYLYISILRGFNTMSITIVVFDLDASITVLYYYRENMITVAKKNS